MVTESCASGMLIYIQIILSLLYIQLKSKKELLEEAEKVGMNAMDSRDLKLLKRRLTKETILENNISGGKVQWVRQYQFQCIHGIEIYVIAV